MAELTKDIVVKIAEQSRIALKDNEIESMLQHLNAVLSYAERVTEIAAGSTEYEQMKNVNVFREDIPRECDPEPILAQAPEREGNFFVVPRILEGNQ